MKNKHFCHSGLGIVLISLCVMSGCSDSSPDPTPEEPKVNSSGFSANVSGAVNSHVSGAGIMTYLLPKPHDSVMGTRPGYYLLANNLLTSPLAEPEFIITFRIPDGAQPGHYMLKTPDPLKIGQDFDAQVEMVQEGKSTAYHRHTEGTITLNNFSFENRQTGTSTVKGTFQFVAENTDGEQVLVTGGFNFSPTLTEFTSI